MKVFLLYFFNYGEFAIIKFKGEHMAKIIVKETEIKVMKIGGEDYICITDMLKAKDGAFFVTDWLRNRNTLEYIGTWESVYNPEFDFGEFSKITNQSGLNSFKISVKEFVERTNAISISAKAGRYGGTYAHKDIAFEFAMWISPIFKIYVVKEFQRLKGEEQKQLGWSARRELAKINSPVRTAAHYLDGGHLNENILRRNTNFLKKPCVSETRGV